MPAAFTRQRPRTCVACRTEAPKRALVRVVRTPAGEAILDMTGKLPGRGAYLCLNPECLRRARKTGALSRALKTALSDACWEELERCVAEQAERSGGKSPAERAREVRSLLGISRRANLLTLGMDAISAAAAAKPGEANALLLLTARGCSEAVQSFAEGLATATRERKHPHEHRPLPLDVEELSAALGTGNVQVIALPARSGLADKLRFLLDA